MSHCITCYQVSVRRNSARKRPKSTLCILFVPAVAFSLPLAGVKELQTCLFGLERLLCQSILSVLFRPHDSYNASVLRRYAVASVKHSPVIPWTINRVSKGLFQFLKI